MRTKLYLTPKMFREGFKVFFFNVPKIIVLTILWFVFSLPFVTLGGATIALCNLLKKMNEEEIKIKDFFSIFLKKIFCGIPYSFLFSLLIVAISFDADLSETYVFLLIGCVALFALIIYYPIAASEYKSLSEIIKINFIYSVYHVLDTILILSISIILLIVISSIGWILILFIIPIMYFVTCRIVYCNNLQIDSELNKKENIS